MGMTRLLVCARPQGYVVHPCCLLQLRILPRALLYACCYAFLLAILMAVCVAAEEEERWRRWVDNRFVRVITVNIYRNARESFQTFDYIAEHGNFSWPERQGARGVGAIMMWALSGADDNPWR